MGSLGYANQDLFFSLLMLLHRILVSNVAGDDWIPYNFELS